MKYLFFMAIPILSISWARAQNNYQLNILDKFINAHNLGTSEAIEQFIKETYSPELYSRVTLTKHVEFYSQLVNEFGRLNLNIYDTIKIDPLKLIVHLIQENQSILNKNINPADILVVEIDLGVEDPKYLERGLGLGSINM